MNIAERLRSHFFTIAVAIGCALAWVQRPLDWYDGFILFLLGSVAGDWNRRLNPAADEIEGPAFPWDDMHAGDKLGYFLPPLAIVIVGLIFFVMAMHFSRVSVDWISISVAIFVVASGIAQAYWKWHHRDRLFDGA